MRQTEARISFISGPVSFPRGDDPEDWQPADRNATKTQGERTCMGRSGRRELRGHGGELGGPGTGRAGPRRLGGNKVAYFCAPKAAAFMVMFSWYRGRFALYSYDHLVHLGWKCMIPTGIALLILTAALGVML